MKYQPRGLLLCNEPMVYRDGIPMLACDLLKIQMGLIGQLAWYEWDHGHTMPAKTQGSLIRRLRKISMILFCFLLLAGCAPDRSMQCNPVGTRIIGRTDVEQVCGPPSRIYYSMYANGVLREQWEYRLLRGDGRSGYIYLEDKVVTGWQVP